MSEAEAITITLVALVGLPVTVVTLTAVMAVMLRLLCMWWYEEGAAPSLERASRIVLVVWVTGGGCAFLIVCATKLLVRSSVLTLLGDLTGVTASAVISATMYRVLAPMSFTKGLIVWFTQAATAAIVITAIVLLVRMTLFQ